MVKKRNEAKFRLLSTSETQWILLRIALNPSLIMLTFPINSDPVKYQAAEGVLGSALPPSSAVQTALLSHLQCTWRLNLLLQPWQSMMIADL